MRRLVGVMGLAATLAGPAASAADWPRFPVVMWQDKTPAQYRSLAGLGITAARVQPDREHPSAAQAEAQTAPLLAAGLQPYLENLATDFYAAYHRWRPGLKVNQSYLAVQAAHQAAPEDLTPFMRVPSLSDAAALGQVEARLTRIAQLYAPYHPLYENLADESGIADLSAAWDFDFSPTALAAYRRWLKTQYPSLAALNREWGSHFSAWSTIVPPTTTATMARSDNNYAAWSDFRQFMDIAFAKAIASGAAALHRGDPAVRAGIEGGQMPGWGGYNYLTLARAVDLMEMYAAGQNMALARAFHPGLTEISTIHVGGPHDSHAAWRAVMYGAQGLVLWDEDNALLTPDGSASEAGQRIAPLFAALHGETGAVLARAHPVEAPVAILYSPESYRLNWLIDHRAAGDGWTTLGAEDENAPDAVRNARAHAVAALGQLGLNPHYLADAGIADGGLRSMKALVLGQALSLSDGAVAAIRRFCARGGSIFVEGEAGRFDDHGRPRNAPALAGLAGCLHHVQPRESASSYAAALQAAGATAMLHISAEPGTEASAIARQVWRDGSSLAVALLAPEGARATVTLDLPGAETARDLVTGMRLGRHQHLVLSLQPDEARVILLTP